MLVQAALLSAYHKDDALRDFAKQLHDLKWKLLASSGTKKFLDEYQIPSTDVADIVGPPILGHRVVTLAREIYAALLARTGNADDMAELKRIGIDPIGLVYVDLYPLKAELQNPKCTFESVVEKTDIGGPTLLRAAAKGGRIVISSPDQFKKALTVARSPADLHELREDKTIARILADFAERAENTVAKYAELSAMFYGAVARGEFPERLRGAIL